MKKNSKLTLITEASLAAVAGLAIANGNVVKADTTTKEATPHVATNNDAKKAQPKSKAEVLADAKKDTSNKKSDLDKANGAVKDAQAKVDSATSAADKAQAEFNQAQKTRDEAKDFRDKYATGDNLDRAQTTAEKATANTKAVSNDLANAQVEEKQAEGDVADAKATNDDAQKAVDAQQTKVDTAQNNLDAAKKDLYDGQSGKAQAAFDSARATAIEKQNRYDNYVESLNANKESLSKVEKNNEQLKNVKTKRDSDLTKAKKNVINAQTKEQTDIQAEKQAEDAVAHLNALMANHLVLNDGYINTIKKFNQKYDDLEAQKEGTSFENQEQLFIKQQQLITDPEFTAAIREYSDQLWKANRFISNDADKKVVVDFDNMTPEQLMELNKYTVSLINEAREQVGSKPLILNNSAIKFAQDVKEEYQNNKINGQEHGHYVEGIERAAEKHGLDNSGQLYEDMGGFNTDFTPGKADSEAEYKLYPNRDRENLKDHEATMDEVKHNIYNGLKQMLFADDEWAHATNLLNAVAYRDANKAPVYFGTSFSVLPGTTDVDTHYELIAEKHIKDTSKFDTNDNVKVPSREELQAQLDVANQDLATKKQTVIDDNAAVATAQKAQQAAQKLADQAAQDVIDSNNMVKSAKNSVEKSQAAVNEAKAQLDQANTNKEKAAQELAKYNEMLEAKRQVVANAQKSLDKENAAMTPLKQNLEKTTSVLTDAQNKLADKRKVQSQLNEQLNQAKKAEKEAYDYFHKILDAPAAYDRACEAYAKTNYALNEALEQLNLKQGVLSDAKGKQEFAQRLYNDALSRENKAQADYDAEVLAQQVAEEQDRLAQEAAEKAQQNAEQKNDEENYEATLFVPVLHNNLNWKVRVLDDQGNYIDKYISTNKTIKVLAKKTVNGKTFYKIADNEWIPAQLTIEQGKEYKIKGIAYMPRLKNHPKWKVAMMDSNGRYTGKYLKTNSHWIIWGKKVINGRLCYRLGTQSQWVPAEFLVIK